jgi:hypothetical protein
MATRERIQCINKSGRQNSHERILNVGGLNDSGSRWRISETEAIEGIERGYWEFYVHVGQNTVNVIIATSAAGNKYLKTAADGVTPDNLLALPECPKP